MQNSICVSSALISVFKEGLDPIVNFINLALLSISQVALLIILFPRLEVIRVSRCNYPSILGRVANFTKVLAS